MVLLMLLLKVFVFNLFKANGRDAFEVKGIYKKIPSAPNAVMSPLAKVPRRPPGAILPMSFVHFRLLSNE